MVACSNCVASSAAGHLGIDVGRITVIHNCVAQHHFDDYPDARRSVRSELGTPDSSFVATCVGTLRWEKGHRFLIEGWKHAIQAGLPEDSELWIVGSGPLEEELRQLSNQLPSIRLLGSRADTAEVLRASDLFVLPSVNEGFGIAIVEAMSAGLRVISTSSGGIPEVIDSDRTGVLVDPRDAGQLVDAITTLFHQLDTRKRLGIAARAEADARFTPRVYVDQLKTLYASVTK